MTSPDAGRLPASSPRNCRMPSSRWSPLRVICRISIIPNTTASCAAHFSPVIAARATGSEGVPMPKVLVLYYSSYGHIEAMAYAQAEGAARVPGAEVIVKRVPELVSPEVAKASYFKVDQAAPLATPDELEQYDGIIFGTPTRFGNMAA